MPCLLVTAASNNGKSFLLQRFLSLHPQEDNPDGRTIIAPIVVVEAPTTPDEGRLYNCILNSICAPHKANDNPDNKKAIIWNAFSAIGVKMLIIDEFHNLLTGGDKKLRQTLNAIKGMSNGLKIPVVATGIDTARIVLRSDPQLDSRFRHMEIKEWGINEEFCRLLKSFEMQLALKEPSGLSTYEMARQLAAVGDGTLGKIAFTLKNAAEVAIRNGTEKITVEMLASLPLMPSRSISNDRAKVGG